MRRFLTTLIAGILIAMPASASPAPELEAFETLIAESAETAADHAALGRFYRSRAELARANADQQEKMARSVLYLYGKGGDERFLKAKRAQAALAFRQQAEAYEARAAAHETAAREADPQHAKELATGTAEVGSETAAR